MISKVNAGLFVLIFLVGNSAIAQSLFLGGGYTLGNRAAGMSAFVADPDYAHSVLLNPARLGYVGTFYAASDYEHFSRGVGELFLPNTPSNYLSNGNLSAWDVSIAFPAGPLGAGAAFSAFDLAGWRTTISSLGIGVPIPMGFAVGITGNYLTVEKEAVISGGLGNYRLNRFTFDIGAMNRTELANTTFFRAILSSGIVFTNVLSKSSWNSGEQSAVPPQLNVNLPQTFECGLAYTFASNYRLYDFELFRVTGAVDYAHLLADKAPIDDFMFQRDQYRVGLETVALGILAVRIGYTLKTPEVEGVDLFNNLTVSRMGSGFSYGFSLRFPVKLVLPVLPVTSLELSYAKNPEWNSAMYHDLFGVVFEMLF